MPCYLAVRYEGCVLLSVNKCPDKDRISAEKQRRKTKIPGRTVTFQALSRKDLIGGLKLAGKNRSFIIITMKK